MCDRLVGEGPALTHRDFLGVGVRGGAAVAAPHALRHGGRDMCGIVGYVGGRPARELLLAGLRSSSTADMTPPASRSSASDGEIESVRAVGNLERARGRHQRRAGVQAAPRRPSPSPTHASHRHRPHPLGHPRARDRGERPPALRHRRTASTSSSTGSSRTTSRCASACADEGAELHLRDRRRGRRPPGRRALRRRPRRGRPRRPTPSSRATTRSSP